MSNLPKGRQPLIAVIDDDACMRIATDGLLRSRGYAVDTYGSAEEFLQSPQLDATSCVITDVRMPTMGGIQLQSALRDQGNHVPCIFITAFPEEEIRTMAMNGGATCFLSKPFDAPTLIGYVETALATRR